MQKTALLEDSHFFPTHFSTDNNKKVIRGAAFGYVIEKDKEGNVHPIMTDFWFCARPFAGNVISPVPRAV